jgi:hypothetical protein
MIRRAGLLISAVAIALGLATVASADRLGPMTFEPPVYTAGPVDGQNGWRAEGRPDMVVVAVADFPAASGYRFGDQALRLSDADDDTLHSPGLADQAGESAARHFDASFRIGTAVATVQAGLNLVVNPVDGGFDSRMSYLSFRDHTDGVHVVFVEATNPGPRWHGTFFTPTDIATLDRASSHSVRLLINFKIGTANDMVKVFIDGRKVLEGTTWEDYHRYDPDLAVDGNVVPAISRLRFTLGGGPSTAGKGFLIDDVKLSSG